MTRHPAPAVAGASAAPRKTHRVLLVDADAFFVAVARLADPDGAGRAACLLVGGDASHRGVVASASYEARAFGVRSAMPMARALKLCPQATVVPVPRHACSEKSRGIRAVLERFAPVVESASIDEWYCSLDGTEALYSDEPLAATALRMRRAIRDETAMSVSIGGGSNRLIAKLAAEVAKPRDTAGTGVHIVPAGEEAAFMRRFTLAEIPQIGPKFQERLARVGLRSVEDALACDRPTLQRLLGDGDSAWLYDRIRGVAAAEVADEAGAKSISREETFSHDIVDETSLRGELRRLVADASADLRDAALRARTISVKLRDHDFHTRQASRTVRDALESERGIAAIAVALLGKLRGARRVPARLVGVTLSQLVPAAEPEQLRFFEVPPGDAAESERDRRVSRTMDQVRQRFGDDALELGRRRSD